MCFVYIWFSILSFHFIRLKFLLLFFLRKHLFVKVFLYTQPVLPLCVSCNLKRTIIPTNNTHLCHISCCSHFTPWFFFLLL
jgi:hypothetical protein